MKATKTTAYDIADYLTSGERIAAYLELALENGDPKALTAALGTVARAKGMTQIARDTGLTREALYRSLTPEGNPTLSTFTAVLDALGLKMRIDATQAPAKVRGLYKKRVA